MMGHGRSRQHREGLDATAKEDIWQEECEEVSNFMNPEGIATEQSGNTWPFLPLTSGREPARWSHLFDPLQVNFMKTRLPLHTLTLALAAALVAAPMAMAQDAQTSKSSAQDTSQKDMTTPRSTSTTAHATTAHATTKDRSAGTVVDDATVTTEVKSKLMANDQTHALNINVDTDSGVVTLAGTATSAKEKSEAARVARSVNGVKSVKNQLVISSDSSANPQTLSAKTKVEAGKAADSTKDGWVTTKVKSKFAASSAVKASDVSVETTNGVVTLTGTVDSAEAKQAAIEQAQQTEGVKSVNSSGLMVGHGK
jgi:osmotically-inducible protein OsmY